MCLSNGMGDEAPALREVKRKMKVQAFAKRHVRSLRPYSTRQGLRWLQSMKDLVAAHKHLH